MSPLSFAVSVGRRASLLLGLLILSPTFAQGAAPDGFAGVWLPATAVTRLTPAGGGAIPFRPAGQKAYSDYRAGLRSGKTEDFTRKYCLPDGVPRLLLAQAPFEIVVTPGHVTFLHEARHVYRDTADNGTHGDPDLASDSFMGDSAGKWEGGTFAIDSIGFTESTRLDADGLPHSSKLHVVERWSLTVDGKRLQAEITIDDPDMYRAPWVTRLTFVSRNDLAIEEYVCGEKHRRPLTGGAAK